FSLEASVNGERGEVGRGALFTVTTAIGAKATSINAARSAAKCVESGPSADRDRMSRLRRERTSPYHLQASAPDPEPTFIRGELLHRCCPKRPSARGQPDQARGCWGARSYQQRPTAIRAYGSEARARLPSPSGVSSCRPEAKMPPHASSGSRSSRRRRTAHSFPRITCPWRRSWASSARLDRDWSGLGAPQKRVSST